MSQEGLNGLFVLLRSLCEICSMKFLELRIYRKLFSDLHLPPSLDAPSGWFYSTCFLRWQSVCLLMSIMGLNPLKITSLDSLAAFIKTQLKYPIESSSSAQTSSAISDCRVTSASPAASHPVWSQPRQTWGGASSSSRSSLVGESLLLSQRVPAPSCWRHGVLQTPRLLEAGAASVISSERSSKRRMSTSSSLPDHSKANFKVVRKRRELTAGWSQLLIPRTWEALLSEREGRNSHFTAQTGRVGRRE